jgi:hypothetical protein
LLPVPTILSDGLKGSPVKDFGQRKEELEIVAESKRIKWK